jgi:hypothetical protein
MALRVRLSLLHSQGHLGIRGRPLGAKVNLRGCAVLETTCSLSQARTRSQRGGAWSFTEFNGGSSTAFLFFGAAWCAGSREQSGRSAREEEEGSEGEEEGEGEGEEGEGKETNGQRDEGAAAKASRKPSATGDGATTPTGEGGEDGSPTGHGNRASRERRTQRREGRNESGGRSTSGQ